MRLVLNNNGVIFFLTLIFVNSMLLLLSCIVNHVVTEKEMISLLKSNLANYGKQPLEESSGGSQEEVKQK